MLLQKLLKIVGRDVIMTFLTQFHAEKTTQRSYTLRALCCPGWDPGVCPTPLGNQVISSGSW